VIGHTDSIRSATPNAAQGAGSVSPSLPSHSSVRATAALSVAVAAAGDGAGSEADRDLSITGIYPREPGDPHS
jgi:hypothetical protein